MWIQPGLYSQFQFYFAPPGLCQVEMRDVSDTMKWIVKGTSLTAFRASVVRSFELPPAISNNLQISLRDELPGFVKHSRLLKSLKVHKNDRVHRVQVVDFSMGLVVSPVVCHYLLPKLFDTTLKIWILLGPLWAIGS